MMGNSLSCLLRCGGMLWIIAVMLRLCFPLFPGLQ